MSRLTEILDALQDMAAGDLESRVPISPNHDELDALAHAVNVVGGELQYTTRRLARARDEAEQANHAKSDFLRNVSHEIRTPLSAILTITQLLQDANVDPSRRDDLYERILANGRSLIALVDDLLDLAKVESGKLAIEIRPVLLRDAIADVERNLESDAQRKHIVLHFDVDEHAVSADPRRLRQILLNVVGNSIKFTERGRVLVRADRHDGVVHVDVLDTGIGVAPEHAVHLFEPFAQGDMATARRFGGTGLGLALSRRLARAMHGELAIVETAAGKGTTVRLSLPAVDQLPAAAPPGMRRPRPDRTLLAGMRVLIADDHEDVREPLAMLLDNRGAHVVEAAGGMEAVAIASRERFDLILMDVRMPDLDGLEATRRLRAAGVSTPIIAMTADVVLERQQEYLDAGYTAQFAKPMDIDHLTSLLRAYRR